MSVKNSLWEVGRFWVCPNLLGLVKRNLYNCQKMNFFRSPILSISIYTSTSSIRADPFDKINFFQHGLSMHSAQRPWPLLPIRTVLLIPKILLFRKINAFGAKKWKYFVIIYLISTAAHEGEWVTITSKADNLLAKIRHTLMDCAHLNDLSQFFGCTIWAEDRVAV